jgi:hypothetical protein
VRAICRNGPASSPGCSPGGAAAADGAGSSRADARRSARRGARGGGSATRSARAGNSKPRAAAARPLGAPLGGRDQALARRRHVGRAHGLAQRVDEETEQAAVVAEAHLGLGRVHVDVDARGIHRQREERRRLAALDQEAAVGVLEHAHEQLVAHRPAVREPHLPRSVGAREARRRDEPASSTPFHAARTGTSAAASSAPNVRRMRAPRSIDGLDVERAPAVVRDDETDVAVRQGQALDHVEQRASSVAVVLRKRRARAC